MAALPELSQAFAQAVEQHGPSIVRVEARHRLSSSGVIWSVDGLIVTTHHALERDEDIEVGLGDGRTVDAKLVGRDPSTDLAVLRVEATGLPVAATGGLDDLKVGHFVLGLARPGRSVRATHGIVSALGDNDGFRTAGGGRIDRYIEVDLQLRPGFSGGSLVDLSGRVLGVNTSALFRSATLTVPVATVQRVVERLVAHGGLRRAYLGVGTQPVRLPPRSVSVAGQESALLVVSIQSEGPSDKAGLLLGDVLLSVNGHLLEEMGDLLEMLSDERVGRELKARVLRAGQVVEVAISAGTRRE